VSNVTEAERGQEEVALTVDFKMVTFTLGGRDYGVDIMNVKEIAKSNQFTYVPNTAPYVRGVHNLRGEIISVIDLRRMFQLDSDFSAKDKGGLENILILRLDSGSIGIIVDTIDHVVGVDSRTIQPPHPLFADINLNYMAGVVEAIGRTYVVLDVERIFGRNQGAATAPPATPRPVAAPRPAKDPELEFVVESLAALRGFHITTLNRRWAEQRFREWKEQKGRSPADLQLTSEQDADAFLRPFWSDEAGRLLDSAAIGELQSLMPESAGPIVKIWDVGCARGHEAYSLAVAARLRFTGAQIKVWAIDNDLLTVSVAPNLIVPKDQVPELYIDSGLVLETPSGYTFGPEIRDAVIFEYHDILHGNEYPTLDIVVARDVLSFLSPEDQKRILDEVESLLRPDGLLIVGKNEVVSGPVWRRVQQGVTSGYRKQSG
jgi:purine-binding chemotaxis protein CheW